jgi:predicted Zn-dependent protease
MLRGIIDRNLSDQQRSHVFYELGEILLYGRHYEQAVDCLTRARESDPTNRLVYHTLATAYARLGKVELAEGAKRRGDEIHKRAARMEKVTMSLLSEPGNPDLRYEAGTILIAEGLKKEGAAWLHTALDCDSGHKKTHRALAEYYADIGDTAAAARHRKLAGEDAERNDGAAAQADLK